MTPDTHPAGHLEEPSCLCLEAHAERGHLVEGCADARGVIPDAHPTETRATIEFGAFAPTEQWAICAAVQMRESDHPLR